MVTKDADNAQTRLGAGEDFVGGLGKRRLHANGVVDFITFNLTAFEVEFTCKNRSATNENGNVGHFGDNTNQQIKIICVRC